MEKKQTYKTEIIIRFWHFNDFISNTSIHIFCFIFNALAQETHIIHKGTEKLCPMRESNSQRSDWSNITSCQFSYTFVPRATTISRKDSCSGREITLRSCMMSMNTRYLNKEVVKYNRIIIQNHILTKHTQWWTFVHIINQYISYSN